MTRWLHAWSLSCAVAGPTALPAQSPTPAPALPAAAVPFPATPPRGLGAAFPAPPENPYDAARFVLGQRLFVDPRLSADDRIACVSCHLPEHGFAHPDPNPPGVHGRRARRHAPTLFNRAFGQTQFWDGRARSLEEQVLMPLADPDEMGMNLDDLVRKLGALPDYRGAFEGVFGRGVDQTNLAHALATFVRGLAHGDTPADRFLEGSRYGLTRAERAGMWIYESKGGCWRCHPRPLFTDERFHNTGVGVRDGRAEDGRMAVTGDADDRGRFKTPTLRGLALTAPYMHDGSLATLRDVVEFYRRGGNQNPDLSPHLRALELSDDEVGFLVAFLAVLSAPGDRGIPNDAAR